MQPFFFLLRIAMMALRVLSFIQVNFCVVYAVKNFCRPMFLVNKAKEYLDMLNKDTGTDRILLVECIL